MGKLSPHQKEIVRSNDEAILSVGSGFNNRGKLEEHRNHLLIGNRHKAGIIKRNGVLQAITRDYLGIENWQDVKDAG